MNKTKLFIFWLMLGAYSFPAFCENGDVSIDINTGAISSSATGTNANASISIGGAPTVKKPGCTHIRVEYGDLQRIAIGDKANASIQLPANQNTCTD